VDDQEICRFFKDFIKTDALKIQPEFEKLGLKLGGLETNFEGRVFEILVYRCSFFQTTSMRV
jgi:hypothetical protein